MAILLPGCQQPAARSRGIRRLQFTDIDGYVEFVTRQRQREQTSKVAARRSFRAEEAFTEENLGLEADGYVYHPNLLDFTLGGLFGLLQRRFEDNFGGRDRSSREDGTVLEFDLSGRILKRKKYPGHVYARRYRAIEPRPFLPSLETTTDNFGLAWRYLSEKVPTGFQFNHTQIDIDPFFGTEAEEGQRRNTNFRFDTGYHFNKHNTLSLTYDRESVEEQPYDLDYDSDEVTLSHRLEFGRDHHHSLDSELNFRDQRGTFDLERARWRENLRLKHSDTLRSWYLFEAVDRTRGSLFGVPQINETSYYLTGTLEHRLYESLITQLSGFLQTQTFDLGPDIDRSGASIRFDYRKKNRWGLLWANYGASLRAEKRSGNDRSIEVLEESHSFRDPEPVTLAHTNIRTSSIAVMDTNRVTIYRSGRDYTIRSLANRIEIERVPTGRILDGQTVLINYVYDLRGSFNLDTVSQNFGIRQNFKFGLAPYYRLRWQDQTVSPRSTTGAVAEDITAHVFGVEYRRRPFGFMAEYEDHDSTINPFEALRVGGDYTHRFKFGASAHVQARWTDIRYHARNERRTEFFTVEGRYRHPLKKRLTFEGAILYRNEQDSISGDDEGVDVDLSLEWFIRRTEIRITYEFGKFEDDFARNEYSTLYVQVKRSF